MATTRKIGFGVSCPECNDGELLDIQINDLGGKVHCADCDATFSIDEAIGILAARADRWRAVQSWIERANALIEPAGDEDF